MKVTTVVASLSLALIAAFASTASAQGVLPRPELPFKGKIGRTYKDSTPDKIPVIQAPAGAPNVLIVLIDDSGFGQWSTFVLRDVRQPGALPRRLDRDLPPRPTAVGDERLLRLRQ